MACIRRKQVTELLSRNSRELREQYGVRSLDLFGSVARDDTTPASDIDLLVEFDRPVGLLHLVGTELYLQQLLNVEKVDLVLRRAVLPELQDAIFTEAVRVL